MSRWILAFSLLAAVGTPYAWGENEGLADLDRATEVKINAKKQSDLTQTIDLCQSALKKGLDEDNTQFAKQLLASSLCERATLASDAAFARGPADPLWQNYRDLALEDFEKAVKLVPELPDALLVIARLNLLPNGDPQRAAKAIESALAIKGVAAPTRSRFLLLSSELQDDDAKRLALLDEAVQLTPNKVEPLRALAELHAKLGKNKQALADLDNVLKLDPQNPEVHEQKAEVLARLKRYDEALVSIDKAQQLNPQSAMPLAIRAQIHIQMDNLEAAMHDINQALLMRPGNPFLLTLRASVYKEMKKPSSALADVDRVLRITPSFDQARRLRWSILIDQNRLDQVVSEMEAQLRKSPTDKNTLVQMAMLYTATRQPLKAIEIYTAILAQDADNIDALQGRANALLGIGKHTEALADFNKAMQLDAEDSSTLNNLAWLLATSPDGTLRDGRRAVKLAEKACELTEYEEAHIISTLAAAYAEAGDFKNAIKWSLKAIDLGKKDDKTIREALEKELKNYQQNKPWRERLNEGLRPSDGGQKVIKGS